MGDQGRLYCETGPNTRFEVFVQFYMKNFLAFAIAAAGILTAASNVSQAQEFTFSFGDGYYAPGYYGYPYYGYDYYHYPGYGYYYYNRPYYRGYYYGPRHRYYRWRHHDLHEWNHD